MQLYKIEGFEQMSDVPTDNLVSWMETTQYNNDNYKAIDKWTPVSSAPGGNFFENTGNDKNRLPFVKSNVLNGNAVLHFTPNRNMSLNNLDGASNDFTMIMVTRQVGGKNERFIQGGTGNKLFGYWGGRKECLHSEGWAVGDDFWKKSDSDWDIFTIRRTTDYMMYGDWIGNNLTIQKTLVLPSKHIVYAIFDGKYVKMVVNDQNNKYVTSRYYEDKNIDNLNSKAGNINQINSLSDATGHYLLKQINTKNYFNSMGTPLYCKPNSQGLNGLNINKDPGGGNENSDGQIAEFILYKTCLGDEDVSKIEAYLGKKWGLLDKMDPNVPGSTNTKGANVGEVNAKPPTLEPKLPVTNLRIWADASTLPNTAGNLGSNWGANTTTDNAYFFNTISPPKIIPNALNKLPVLQFTPTSVLSNNKILVPSQRQFTLAFVARQMGGSNQRLIVDGVPQGNRNVYGYCYGNKSVVYMGSDWNWGPGRPNTGPSDSNWDLYIIMQNYRQQLTIMRNNQIICQGVSTLGGTFNGIGINCNGIPEQSSDGQVAEILVWDRGLLNSEISIVSTYLIKKWNLQLFLDKKDPLYNEGVEIKKQRDQEAAIYAIQEAQIKALKEAAESAEIARKAKADADARAAADAAILKKQKDAIAAAEKQIADAKKALEDAQRKEKKAAEEQAIAAAAIAAKQQAAIDAAKKQDEELRKQLANEQASAAQILAAAKTYAEQQKKIQEENALLFNSKLAAAEQTLVNKTNLFNSKLASTISEKDTKFKSALTLAETNLQKALMEAERRENSRVKRIIDEDQHLLKIRLNTQKATCQEMVNKMNKQKLQMQESNASILKTSLLEAQKKLAQTVSQNATIADKKYKTLEEVSYKRHHTLAEQLIKLQDKYNKDIYNIAKEASLKYNTLQETDIIKITNLQKQLMIASNSLANSHIKYKTLQEETRSLRISTKEKIKALTEAATMAANKAINNYNELQKLNDKKYNTLQEASQMIASKAVDEYNYLQEQSKLALKKADKQYKNLEETTTINLNNANIQLKSLQEGASDAAKEAYAQYKALEENTLNAAKKSYQEFQEKEKAAELANKKKIEDLNAVQQNAIKKVIATNKNEATKVAKGKSKKDSSKKGSTKKDSSKKGSTKKGSTKKGSTKKDSSKKGSTKKGSTKKKVKDSFSNLEEASISVIAKAVEAIKKALA